MSIYRQKMVQNKRQTMIYIIVFSLVNHHIDVKLFLLKTMINFSRKL